MIARAAAAMLMWCSSHASSGQPPPRRLTDADKLVLLDLMRDESRVLIPSQSFGCKFVIIDSARGDVCVTDDADVRSITPAEMTALAKMKWRP